MWSPQICLFLVVTPLLVRAAPAAQTAQSIENKSIQQHLVNVESEDLTVKRSASVDSLDSTVKRSARIDSFLAIPSTGFSCSAQAVPGIYADQETGCQVFHYCQDGGRMDSFFCPNLTLFNQQYFVCDWSYNVDCNSAHQYFSLNEALYKTPEKISQAINPAIKIVQNEFLQGAASSEVSRTLNSLVSQLDSRSSAIVVDSALTPTLLVNPTNTNSFPPNTFDRESKSKSSIKGDAERTGKSLESGLSSYGNTIISSTDTKTPIIVETKPIVVAVVTVSPVIENVPTANTDPAEQASYYDDSADPEPTDFLGQYNSYDSSSVANTYTADISYADATDNAYDDAVADPEPACFYDGSCGPAGASDPVYSNYDSPSPSYGDAVNSVYDPYDSADPEPSAIPYSSSGSYGQYDSADPEPDSYYGYYDSADPEPASYYGVNTIDLSSPPQASYQPSASSQYSNSDAATSLTLDYDDASADPEPDPSSYGSDINLYDSGSQQPSYKSYTPSNAISDYYKGYPSQGLVVDSPDPEPSADPEFTPYGE